MTSRRPALLAIFTLLTLSCGGRSPAGGGGGGTGATAGGGGTGGGEETTADAAAGGGPRGSADTAVAPAPDAAPALDAAPESDVAAGDAAPARLDAAPAGGRHGRATIVWGYGEHSPTPKPTDPPKGFDLQMKARLEARGLMVDMVVDALSTVAAVTDKIDVLVISSSINRTNLFDGGKARFKDVAIPTIVMKDGTIEVMGLGTGSAGGFSTGVGETQISIIAAKDPLAAGLMGNVTVYTKGDRLIWANPGPMARKIATVVGQPAQITIFAYAAGAPMVGGNVAPAKRMGFFIHRNTSYSADGLKLFDAALDYLLAP
jgi:hypothetical protein